MIYLILGLSLSIILNILLIWYVFKVLSKLLYTSDNLGDLYASFRIFEDFAASLYQMDMFYGEPILQELVGKIKFIREEIERFEEIYELTTDIELLEEELSSEDADEEKSFEETQKPLFHTNT